MTARHRRLAAAMIVFMAVTLATGWLVGRTPPAGTGWGKAGADVRAVMWPEPQPLAEVELTTQHGRRFTRSDFEGRWSLVFFGYTQCPDVCPTSLNAMRGMRRVLERSGQNGDEQYLFVSVDPANDQPGQMAEYLAGFDRDFIGLHGPEADIRRLADSMAVKFESFEAYNGFRSIDHTSSLMMIDPQGRMVGALPPPLVPERMVKRYRDLREYLENRS